MLDDKAWLAVHDEAQRTAEYYSDGSQDAEDFFTRNGFDHGARQMCDDYAQGLFPGIALGVMQPQGYCSYTLETSTGQLVQFRPDSFKLDMDVCDEATEVYENLVPETTYLGQVAVRHANEDNSSDISTLHVYQQQRISGVNLTTFRRGNSSQDDPRICRERLVDDLAEFFASSFRSGQSWRGSKSKGKVGGSLRWRVELLKGLPKRQLAGHAARIQRGLSSIEELPWCLTHGDLVPANIMVDPATGRLSGLIDWAEGEWLPFGVGLYGLEEVLGEEDGEGQQFRYYPEHEGLRRRFWARFLHLLEEGELAGARSGTGTGRAFLRDVDAARRLGIMLWRGIAFDDGRIDRAVEAGRDDAELRKLELFLQAPGVEDSAGWPRSGQDRSWCGRVVCAWGAARDSVVRSLCGMLMPLKGQRAEAS